MTRRVTLANGLRVLAAASPGADVFSLALSLEAGSRYDSDEAAGLSSLTAGLMLEGTEYLTGSELALRADAAGASLDVVAGYETCSVLVTGLVEGMDESLGIVADLLRAPRLRAEELERARRKQVAEIAEDEDDPFTVARQEFFDLVYGDHPRHRPVSGARDTLAALTLDDVASFRDGFFRPWNAVLAAAGDVEPERFAEAAERVLGDWTSERAPAPPFPERPPAVARRRFTRRDRTQTHVIVGGIGITRDDPSYHAVSLMDVVLGDSAGFGSRLGRRLRESEGLAYIIESDTASTAGLDPGVLWVYTATSPDRAERALAVVEEELERLRSEAPDPGELERAKAYLRGRRLVEGESSEERASRLVRCERYRLGPDYEDIYERTLAAVTRDDVLEAASRLLDPGRRSTVVVGPTPLN
ncbi:MAG: pitrilysin family protein [Candidatus Eisenbacteria bacterium]